MNNKTYKTLENAYAAAEKNGARAFGSEFYAYAKCVDEILAKQYPTAKARTFAKWNLAKFDKTLCALECTKDKTYKWTAVGHFDSEGLLYPFKVECESQEEPKVADKPKADKPKKPSTKGKSKIQLDLDKLAGTGDNKAAHKIMCEHGFKNSNSPEYQEVWKGYWWTIR